VSDDSYVLDVASTAVRAAIARGADVAEAYMQYGRILRLVFQDDHLISQSTGWQNGLALRVWSRKNVALLTTNDFSRANLHALAARAVGEAPGYGITSAPLLRQEKPSVSVFPACMETEVATQDKIATITDLLKTLKRNRLLADFLMSTCYSENAPWTALANSYGFQVAHQARRSALWLWGESGRGQIRDAVFGPSFSLLEPAALVMRLQKRSEIVDQSTARVPAGPCEVLLSPPAAADLALALGTLFSAENVLRYLPALLNYMGKKIATSAVTLIDDGKMPTGLQTRMVDDEGTPTQKITIIENGRLRSLLHSLQTARQLGVQPNGAATRRALWQEPRSTPSNIYLQAGTAQPEELVQQMKHGILVNNVLRQGIVQNETGKFTLIVQGWWVEHGTVCYAVSDVQIAANIFELVHNIRCCGNDLSFFYHSYGAGAPSVLIENVQVSQEGAGHVV
jgi:PmbA protein